MENDSVETVCDVLRRIARARSRPNVLFLRMSATPEREEDDRTVIREADRAKVGTMSTCMLARDSGLESALA